MSAIYHPRAAAVLTVPAFGSPAQRAAQLQSDDVQSIPVQVVSATLERNSHLEADTLRVEVSLDAGIDPRLLRDCVCTFWLGDSSPGAADITTSAPVFIGIATDIERRGAEGQGTRVAMTFLDFTTLFLNSKPYPATGTPTFTDTISSAWTKICANTGYWDVSEQAIKSSVAVLADRLEIIGVDDLRLGSSVPSRIARFGSFTCHKDGDSAWDVWLRVVGSLGLITWIDGDVCYVAPTTEHFGEGAAPRLVLGDNIDQWAEKADSKIGGKGVGVTSINTITGKVLEAFYPPPGDPRVKRKRMPARRANPGEPLAPEFVATLKELHIPVGHGAGGSTSKGQAFPADSYEMFEYHDVADQAALDQIAEKTYGERARQEIQGTISTVEMNVLASDGNAVDLLSLRAGDPIRVELSPDYEELLRSKGDDTSIVEYLSERGADPDTALLIARNVKYLPALRPVYHVKRVTTSIDEQRFSVSIHYWNLIRPLGDSGTDG